MPRRNGNGVTSQYVQPVCFESLGSYLDFHPTRPKTHALFSLVGGTPVLGQTFGQHVKESFCTFWPERVMAPGTSTSSTATTFAGMNHVDAHLHDNLGLLSSRSTFAIGASISYLGVAPHKFLICSYKVTSHPSQSQCETGGGAHMVSLDCKSSTLLLSTVTRSSPLSTSRNVAWPTVRSQP
ncbi:uncharacterized protein LACBIDRAFT_299522 [Laccaria bicolor S238N-H82]|uniref:Predicted protein n=1 Tax=Laccaria bicolor (strain S238N-H82 / ATCC MYA-4686) TaxID=486041 RepID=B0E3Q5_LACBS|nr:uncharacterized protein LACBIDRAFT_299522 [Laccaria bicolor S238N-H82]EDQ98527.1 predicted protein [Laccaria bicolor S238N-H82]|eukprot:XP_001890821.1 predicted protein [Laccaria bicolor S238N-H82]